MTKKHIPEIAATDKTDKDFCIDSCIAQFYSECAIKLQESHK